MSNYTEGPTAQRATGSQSHWKKQTQMVLGAIHQQGGSMVPSDLRANYQDAFSELECPVEGLDHRTIAVINIDIGVREALKEGLIEEQRTEQGLKTFALTQAGQSLS